MKNLIMGTAGHIDHGKTSLIEALTSINCDTHPEEKKRGITINLGFTHLDLPNGNSIGIVDVPGHSDFINTMVAGAYGIDFVMLVIAADSGIMPQTIEHLHIMEMLGVRHGLIALTKVDLVETEVLNLVTNELNEFTKSTFLESKPIINTSIKSSQGLAELKKEIEKISEKIEERRKSQIFRMFIDRFFNVKGFGTVVTGSVLGGSVKTDEHLYLIPGMKKLRVRRIERHEKELSQVNAGNRASLNLVGLEKKDFQRGMVLSDRALKLTNRIDVKLKIFSEIKLVRQWSNVIFLTGTYKNQARIHLMQSDQIKGDETGIAQIELSDPVAVLFGDKFIIRNSSGTKTLGGGEIIDAHPLHHKKRTKKLLDQLRILGQGNIYGLIFIELIKNRIPLPVSHFTELSGYSEEIIINSMDSHHSTEIETLADSKETYFILSELKEKLLSKLLKSLKNFHKRNPLLENGRSLDEMLSILKMKDSLEFITPLKIIIDELIEEGQIKKVNNSYALSGHKINLSDKDEKQINFVEDYFINLGMHVGSDDDLIIKSKKNGIDGNQLNQIIQLLITKKKLYKIQNTNLHKSIVDPCRNKLSAFLKRNEDGITVAGFRDLVNGNRKICLLLFALFDDEGLTYRDGDYRKLNISK
jgi:selenocysteine-specific elongation factor